MNDELCIEVGGMTLDGLQAQTYLLFWAMWAKRERPEILASKDYCYAYPYIRQSDNPAIRAKAARLVPETYTNGSAA